MMLRRMVMMIMTQVCSGLGDLQCSVRAILGFDKKGSQFSDAVINVSTSAQVLRTVMIVMGMILIMMMTAMTMENMLFGKPWDKIPSLSDFFIGSPNDLFFMRHISCCICDASQIQAKQMARREY